MTQPGSQVGDASGGYSVRTDDESGEIQVIAWGFWNVDVATSFRPTVLEACTARPSKRLVLDLRKNPGGSLDEAVALSDLFLTDGQIVSQRGRNPRDSVYYEAESVYRGDVANGLPMIVLIDSGSASASEIVAGALQDQRRALVMGERSFGKGSVQTVQIMGPKSALRLTTARYYTPSGRSVQEGGVEPDILVPQLTDPDYKSRPRLREADLKRHLLAQSKVEDKLLEADNSPDPRFSAKPEELKKKGIKDFQLDYALRTLKRLGTRGTNVAAAGTPKKS